MLSHNSHDPYFRYPGGPQPCGARVTIRFLCDEAADVLLRTWNGGEHAYPMTRDGSLWSHTITLPDTPGLFWYDFMVVTMDGRLLRYGNADDLMGGEGRIWTEGLKSYQLTVYDPAYHTPEYLHGATIYQILPDRFRRAPTESRDHRRDRHLHQSWDEPLLQGGTRRTADYMANEFYGGTINGIREKLPYLHGMGIDVLYLNPIFEAWSFHRYDTGDYARIDPLLGTEAEFRALCEEAAQYGMRIMLDGVFSHTGDDSRYFNRYGRYDSVGAWQSKKSPYFSWYTFEHYPNKYRCWWNFRTLPECRKDDPDYQRFMFNAKDGIVRRWVRGGSAGWRLDVADELSMDFLRKLRAAVKAEDPEAAVLGEVWEDASNKVAYDELRCYCTGDTLDSVMNYPLREAILAFLSGKAPASHLVRTVRHQQEVYPVPFRYSLMNLVGSHDRPRALNMLVGKDGDGLTRDEQAEVRLSPEEYELAVRRYKLCIDLLCALPGCPTVYYGDEAGMTGCMDPYNRKAYPWGHEDLSLRQYVQNKLAHRQRSQVLRSGYCYIEALDDDTVRIIRFLRETDVFGKPASAGDREIIQVRRI